MFNDNSAIYYLLFGIATGSMISIVVSVSIMYNIDRIGGNWYKYLAIIDTVNNYSAVSNKSVTTLSDHAIISSPSTTIRLFCWILTVGSNYDSRARHVKATWVNQCDKYLFISSINDTSLPSIALPNVSTDYSNLWGRTKSAFRYIYHTELNNRFDWYLKSDDDTYVNVNVLRQFLANRSTNDAIYYGCKFSIEVANGYMSGGAGYVLNAEALRRFVVVALTDGKNCRIGDDGGNEDVEMGKCMQAVGVVAGDSRDAYGKHRFMPQHPVDLVVPQVLERNSGWLHSYMYYKFEQGMNCCSAHPITFHWLKMEDMYLFDYLLHRARVFGRRIDN